METTTFKELSTLRTRSLGAMIEAKENGRKVVGYYCNYSPVELAMAAGAMVMPLCGSKKGPLIAADNDLPQNLCPVVRTLYDLAVTDKCPYFHFSDMVIAETTCDGKKKAYEFLQRIKPVHVMNLPQVQDLPSSLTMWESEVRRLRDVMEDWLGTKIMDEAIKEAIHLTNTEARARQDLFDLNRVRPALLTGKELLAISSNAEFAINKPEIIELLDRFTAEVKALAEEGYHVGTHGTPRVLLTGCPVGEDDDKVITLVEECGGLVVAMENCGGYKTLDLRIDETDARDPLTLIAEKYLKVPCSVMSPNGRRLELLERMIKDFDIDGVIDLTWQACHTYNIESYWVAKLVKQKLGKAFLHLETNFSDSDSENLRVRIEAFLEMIKI
jgi:benzoyl-CoA reductase/2-hydroxyglutaryl-CoA dehydratase subunit BcrC/BadD/HgdB